MTPSHLRGRVAALFSFCIVLVGSTIGPSSVAFFTDVVFKDESKVQWSVAASMVIFGAIATVLLIVARGPMRRAAAAAQAAE
jgi:MFS family permease